MKPVIEEPWQAIHHQATVVDLHAHPSLKVALFHRVLGRRVQAISRAFSPLSFRTSFPQLQAGGVDVLLSAIYVPEAPILDDLPALRLLRYLRPRTWRDIIQPDYQLVTQRLLTGIEEQVDDYNRKLQPGQRPGQVVKSVAELDAAVAQGQTGPIAFVHTVEGGHSLHGPMGGKFVDPAADTPPAVAAEVMANLQALFDRGVASLTLAHFYPNWLVSPVFPFPEKILALARWRQALARHDLTHGLSVLGEQVVNWMLDRGMLIDVSHCTPAARLRVYQLANNMGKKSAVMATHVGAYAIKPSPYNLQDWEIRWLADHGGLVGVIFMNYWLMAHETALGLDFVSRTLEHFITAGGTENVAAFGSDFDGFTDPPDDLVDASQLPRLTQRLVSEYGPAGRKYSDAAIQKILGGNALNVLRAGWGRKSSGGSA
jgi:membrane dipeptidase